MELAVEDLVQQRGGRTIIDRMTFRVPSGSALVLTGPNGAGKTTLLRTLAGFLPPVSGRICLDGGDAERSIAEQCHVVGHLNGIKGNLTVSENLSFWAQYFGAGRRADDGIQSALEAFAIESLANIPTAYLSAGQKRRVALARLRVAERPIWLLDEPTASLDAHSAKLLSDAVNRHTKGGGLAIIATHLPLGIANMTELRIGFSKEAA